MSKSSGIYVPTDRYLAESVFRREFLYPYTNDGNNAFKKVVADGLPRVEIMGEWYYPKEKCQGWYRGEEV
ncbi:MAG: hypothetical protein ACOX8Q_01805 [Christensenellales bacterium]|jgi:hypothetical protein